MKRFLRFLPICVALILALSAVRAGFSADGGGSSADPQKRIRSARQSLQQDIESAREELSSLRDRVDSQRLDMVDKLEKLRGEIDNLESELSQRQQSREKAGQKLQATRDRSEQLRQVAEFLRGTVAEYRRGFEARLTAAAAQRYQDRLERVDRLLNSGSLTEKLQALPEMFSLVRTYNRDQLGGTRFDGQALGRDGHLYDGRFAQAGPLCYFAGNSGPAGLTVQKAGSLKPTIFSDFSSSDATASIRNLVKTGEATVPMDPTLGSAMQLRESEGSWIEHLRKGGLTMIPLLLLAAAAACIALYKFVALQLVGARQSEEKVRDVLTALQRDNPERARELADSYRPPLGPVLIEGIEHRNASKEQIEEIMYERLLAQMPSLERFLSALAVCASVAPLLGLLGTVTGMIHTFQLITIFGTGEASTLSSGISEALVTTEFGLIIAVPALLVHAYLSRRVKKTVSRTQQAAIMFVNGLKLRNHSGE